MISHFDELLNWPEVQPEGSIADCTRTGYETVVNGQLKSGKLR